jgi:hypothetical protein
MDGSLPWAVTAKLQKYPSFFGYFIPWLSLSKHFDTKCVGIHIG